MSKKENKLTIADMSETLLDKLSQAYAGSYAQAHPDMRQEFLKQAKRLQAHSDDSDVYYQVKYDLRHIVVDLLVDGGVKPLDPSLQPLGNYVTKLDNGSLGRAAGGWAAMLPVWFGGMH